MRLGTAKNVSQMDVRVGRKKDSQEAPSCLDPLGSILLALSAFHVAVEADQQGYLKFMRRQVEQSSLGKVGSEWLRKLSCEPQRLENLFLLFSSLSLSILLRSLALVPSAQRAGIPATFLPADHTWDVVAKAEIGQTV